MIEDMIYSVQHSLTAENWVAAITVALTLPDICARIDGSYDGGSQARYAAWFEKYVATLPTTTGLPVCPYRDFMSGNDCYALRCAFLHEGDVEIDPVRHKRAHEYINVFPFRVSDINPWSIGMACESIQRTILELDPRFFGNDICRAVSAWMDEAKGDADIQTRITNLPRVLDHR